MRKFAALAALVAMSLVAYAAENHPRHQAVRDEPYVGPPVQIAPQVDLRGPGVIVYDGYPVPVGTTPDPTNPYNLFRSGDNPARTAYPVSLQCGPAEGASAGNPLTLSSMDIVVRTVGNGPFTWDILISFYDNHNPSATPAITSQVGTTIRHSVVGYALNNGRYYATINLAGAGISLDDPDFVIELLHVTPGGSATDTFPNQNATCSATLGGFGPTASMNADPPSAGNADGFVYLEQICGQPAPCDVIDNVWAPCDYINFGLYCPFRIYAQPPLPATLPPGTAPAAACLGVLVDDNANGVGNPGTLVITFPLAAGEVRWFKMVLTENIDGPPVTTGEYLDIHTEGSDLVPVNDPTVEDDTVIAVYDSKQVGTVNGFIVAVNDDADATVGSPAGHHKSLLSFGSDVVRAYPVINPPVGYDTLIAGGQDGPLSKGELYLAASGFPHSAGACRWQYSSTSLDHGTMVLNLSAHLVNACAGDLNGDKVVNESDLGILLGAWQSGRCGDLNRDGQSAEADLGILLANWQNVCGPN
ncbi:MAG: hypothetical protein U1D55_17735 [Phycisphaerae bacterium]